jgi:predicted MFS family arabinose efflux permease
MAGPLVAFAILLIAPRAFDAVFVVSFCFALVGAAVLAAFVRNPSGGGRQLQSDDRPSLRTMAAMLRSRRFLTIAVVAAALGLATISDSLLYVVLQQRLGLDLALFPLLYVGTALAFMILAIPVGRIADQVGRFRTFVVGYVVLMAAYLLLLAPAFGAIQALLVVTLLGIYYAMTDGVLMALASTAIPSGARASGLGIIATASSLGRLVASVAFGVVWTLSSIETATATFAGLLILAIAISAFLVRRWENSGDVEIAAT